eukprot:jgi/Psemu1/59671/gm1.59671_g
MRKQKIQEVQAYWAGLFEEAVSSTTPLANKYITTIQRGIHNDMKIRKNQRNVVAMLKYKYVDTNIKA